MKKHLLLSLFLLAGFALAFTSCKKDKGPSRQQLMVGTWYYAATGADLNNNNVLDSTEVEELPEGFEVLYAFRGDNTGKIVATIPNQSTETSDFSWRLISNDDILELSSEQNTTNLNITKLTDQEFHANGLVGNQRFFLVWKK